MAFPVASRLGFLMCLIAVFQIGAPQEDGHIASAVAETLSAPTEPPAASNPKPVSPNDGSRVSKGEEIRPDLSKSQASEPKREEDLLPMFPAKAPEQRKSGKPSFQIRCWQRGILLFGENDVSEASANDFLERAGRRSGKPFEKLAPGQMQIVDFQDTLCTIKRRS